MMLNISPSSDYPCVQSTQTVRHGQSFQRFFGSSSAYQDTEVLHCDLVFLTTCFTSTQASPQKYKLNSYFVSTFSAFTSITITVTADHGSSSPSCSVYPKAISGICFNVVIIVPSANAPPFHL